MAEIEDAGSGTHIDERYALSIRSDGLACAPSHGGVVLGQELIHNVVESLDKRRGKGQEAA